jgi:hypothetical protein
LVGNSSINFSPLRARTIFDRISDARDHGLDRDLSQKIGEIEFSMIVPFFLRFAKKKTLGPLDAVSLGRVRGLSKWNGFSFVLNGERF